MYVLTKTTETELNKVQATIAKELASEKIIQEIYEYIFNVKGKKNQSIIMFACF
jgi:geranylgeranyl pyrophosphate synthase